MSGILPNFVNHKEEEKRRRWCCEVSVNCRCDRVSMERYEIVKDIGSENFGVARLVRDKWTRELYAVKFIEISQKIDEHVEREIMNHRSLKHPNIVQFKEVRK